MSRISRAGAPGGQIGFTKHFGLRNCGHCESTTDEMAQALVAARTTLATKSYDFDEARLRSRNAAMALEASHAAFEALMAENDRLRASRHHHSK